MCSAPLRRPCSRLSSICGACSGDCLRAPPGALPRFGVSPKWILARYRLHEALHRLHQQPAPRLTDLAADTGFADAAHFSRSFRSVLGVSPQQYAHLWQS